MRTYSNSRACKRTHIGCVPWSDSVHLPPREVLPRVSRGKKAGKGKQSPEDRIPSLGDTGNQTQGVHKPGKHSFIELHAQPGIFPELSDFLCFRLIMFLVTLSRVAGWRV